MKVIVFGATGGTGRATVEELLDGGHEVTGFARHVGAPSSRPAKFRAMAGDVLDPRQVEHALEGHEAVVISLGVNENPLKVRLFGGRSRTPVDVCSRGTRNILEAMKRLGVRKLVVVSAFGVGATRDQLPLPFRLLYRLLLKEQIADKERQEELIRDSGLDWVIVQPVGLTDQQPRGRIHVSSIGEVKRNTIPRRNVGRFVASAVTSDEFLQRSVALSG